MMVSILDTIIDYKKDEVASAKARRPLSSLEEDAKDAPAPRDFLGALRAQQPALIAEIKKASPSKGLIRKDFDPAALALAYQAGGAACLSVLTDAPSFQGSAEALIAARQATSLPVLRKDFMIDPYQVVEARAMSADCILVIMACTSDGLAHDLMNAAKDYGMAALVEVHDEQELDRAAHLKADFIGINNRNLNTFEVNLETTERLLRQLPSSAVSVSESGITTFEDITRLSRAGAHAFLVGESLMRHQNVEHATRALLGHAITPAAQ